MKMEQREVDNMLLSMIQKHFPSLPLSDEHTDWGKWLGFARAVYEAGRASPASAPEVRESVIEAIAEALGDAYDCTRVWSAWSYGTMSQDDFSLVAEDRSRLEEIADAAMLAAAPTPPVSEDKDKIIAAANALENIASTSSSTRIRRVANEALTAIRARRN